MNQADMGNMEAAFELAVMNYYGLSMKEGTTGRNHELAYHYLKQVSDSDSPHKEEAERLIGHMYYDGTVPNEDQSYEKALQYIMNSSMLSAKAHAAYMLSIGSGCKFDYEETKKCYLAFVDDADVSAKKLFADFLFDHGDFPLAVKYYQEVLASNKANPNEMAAYRLGLIYKAGTHQIPYSPDYSMAEQYFRMLENSDRYGARVCFEIGVLYFKPTGSFEKSFEYAKEYFERAAEKGYIEADYYLGYMYDFGHLGTNVPEAIKHYEIAAKSGHVLSAIQLAYLYQELDNPDFSKAFRWAEWASRQHNATAYFVYANFLFLGRGCTQDFRKALEYYRKAKEHGISDAQTMILIVKKLIEGQ